MPYEQVRSYLDPYAYSGAVEYFTRDYYLAAIGRSRAVGGMLLLAGSAMLLAMRRLAGWMGNFMGHAVGQASEIRHAMVLAEGRAGKWFFWSIFLSGLGIRLAFVGQPVRADEATTFIAFAARPFPILFSDWSAPNNQILHTALVRLFFMAFGYQPIALRMPAFLAGICFLPIVFSWAKKYYDQTSALLLMAWCAAAYPFVLYATMGRGYSLLFCFTYLLFLIAEYLRNHPDNQLAWGGGVLVAVAGFLTIPTMLYSFAGTGIWMFFSGPYADSAMRPWAWRRRLGCFAAFVGCGVGLVYAPAFIATDWAVIAKDQTLIGGRSWGYVLNGLSRWLPGLLSGLTIKPNWLGIVFWALGLWGLGMRFRNGHQKLPLWAVVWGLALAMPMLLQRTLPYHRIYIVFYPLLLGLLFSGLSNLFSRLRNKALRTAGITAAILVVVMAGTVHLLSVYPQRHFKTGDQFMAAEKALLYLQAHGGSEDIYVTYMPSAGPMVFYAKKHGFLPRILDLLEDVPRFASGDHNAWIVVNREHTLTKEHYFSILNQPEYTDRAQLKLDIEGAEIFKIPNVKASEIHRVWRYPFEPGRKQSTDQNQ